MKYFALTLLALGLALTQSTPVAKKVEKRIAIESTKIAVSPKLLNPTDELENFKQKTLNFEDPKIEKFNDAKKNEKMEEGEDLKKVDQRDKLKPEDDSEAEEIDREKKSCKIIETPAAPPTKICLEISSSPGQVEICEDDLVPPPIEPHEPLPLCQEPLPQCQEPLPQPQINFKPQPIFEAVQPRPVPQFQPQIIYEEPQVMYMPPPPPPKPSIICFEIFPQQIIPQQESVIQVHPQMIQPQMPQPQVIQIQPQCIEPQVIQFQPQQQFGNPQSLHESHKYRKHFHKLHSKFPKWLKTKTHDSGSEFGYFGPSSAPCMPTCTCQLGGSINGLVYPGGNQVSFGGLPISSGNFAINPVESTGLATSVRVSDNSQTRNGGLRFEMSGQGIRHIRGESGTPPHELETEQKSYIHSSEKEEQSSQISFSQPSSSLPIFRISTPHQSSKSIFSQSGLMTDKNNMNEDNMNMRNIEFQG